MAWTFGLLWSLLYIQWSTSMSLSLVVILLSMTIVHIVATASVVLIIYITADIITASILTIARSMTPSSTTVRASCWWHILRCLKRCALIERQHLTLRSVIMTEFLNEVINVPWIVLLLPEYICTCGDFLDKDLSLFAFAYFYAFLDDIIAIAILHHGIQCTV